MLSLYFFGDIVEYYFLATFGESTGILCYTILYLLGIIVSGIPSYLDNKNNAYYNALGASGGVSAVVFAAILFDPLSKIYLYFAIGIPGFIYAILYSFYSYYMSKRNLDNIGHSAHLWGAGFGVAFTLLLEPSLFLHFINQILSWSL
jgi:membrane associated rhomboid family serine protease